MTEGKNIDGKREELERRLAEVQREAEYYRTLAEETGKRSIREIDQLLTNVSERRRFEEKLTYILDLDRIVGEVSTRFLRLPPGELDDGILWMLERIGVFFGVDRAFLMKKNDHSGQVECSHEWTAPGVDPRDDASRSFQLGRRHESLIAALEKRGCIIPGASSIDEKDPRRIFVTSEEIRASLIMPMVYCDSLTGFLGFDHIHTERDWTNEDILTVHTISDLVINANQRAKMDAERIRLEEQLQIRQRMDSLGTLAGGIAHDFSNLMVGIMGNIELMRLTGDNLTEEQKEYVEEAFSSCRHATELIREIQNLSKRRKTEKKSVDIHVVTSDVISILSRTTDKRIAKRALFRPGQYFVHANEGQLHQVLLNLGTNAVQAIEERGVGAGDRIVISAKKYHVTDHDRTDLPPGEYIHLFFSDTGPGMSETVRKKAFEPMFTTRRGSQKGQGLGLAMVYNIISRNHGGYIDIETGEGQGTIIHVYLPAASAEYSAHTETKTLIGGRETILVIDDEKSVRKFLRDSLKMLGYKVITATNGERGLDVYRKQWQTIDLVILDLSTQHIAGETVLDSILSANPDVRVIVSSGHGDARLDSVNCNAGVLPKPYEISTLAEVVRRLLDGRCDQPEIEEQQ